MVKCHKCGKEFPGEVTDHKDRVMANRICDNCLSISDEWDKLPKIIAVDFDGVLSDGIFPYIGNINYPLLSELVRLQEEGKKIILWTCRTGQYLDDAIEATKDYINFDAINRNIQEVIDMCGGDTRKVYADYYIDDKAIKYTFRDISIEELIRRSPRCL